MPMHLRWILLGVDVSVEGCGAHVREASSSPGVGKLDTMFDRLIFKGHMSRLYVPRALPAFLWSQDIPLTGFAPTSRTGPRVTLDHAEQIGRQAGRRAGCRGILQCRTRRGGRLARRDVAPAITRPVISRTCSTPALLATGRIHHLHVAVERSALDGDRQGATAQTTCKAHPGLVQEGEGVPEAPEQRVGIHDSGRPHLSDRRVGRTQPAVPGVLLPPASAPECLLARQRRYVSAGCAGQRRTDPARTLSSGSASAADTECRMPAKGGGFSGTEGCSAETQKVGVSERWFGSCVWEPTAAGRGVAGWLPRGWFRRRLGFRRWRRV